MINILHFRDLWGSTRVSGSQLIAKTLLSICLVAAICGSANAQTPVAVNGKLHIVGTQLVNEAGTPVQLRGMSSHGINWWTEDYNFDSLSVMVNTWGIDVFRIAVYPSDGNDPTANGYEGNPAFWKSYVDNLVDICGKLGVYCMIDWHVLTPGDPMDPAFINHAKEFWTYMSAKHAGKKHVLYEICNEPNGSTDWAKVKTYAQVIIPLIRFNDPSTIIICGNPTWSSDVRSAADSPITGVTNLMYSFHFYAASHKQDYRDNVTYALGKGLAIFMTEWGSCDASGTGANDVPETNKWITFMRENKLSWCNWSYCDKAETAATLVPGSGSLMQWNNTNAQGDWIKTLLSTPADTWSSSGNWVPAASVAFPLNGTYFLPNTPITIKGTAVDRDGTISSVKCLVDGVVVGSSAAAPYSFTWTPTAPKDYVVTVQATDSAGATATSLPVTYKVVAAMPAQSPFGGTAYALPAVVGATQSPALSTVNFDNGGELVAYHDLDAAHKGPKTGNARQTEGVDVEGTSNIGYVLTGEWLEYTVNNTAASGSFDVALNYATGIASGGSFHFECNGVSTPVVVAPATSGWGDYRVLTATGLPIPAGLQVVRLYFDRGNINVSTIAFTRRNSIPTYTVTVSAGAGGAIYYNGTAVVGAVSVPANADAGFEIRPNAGFTTNSLRVDSATVPVVSPYTFLNVSGNHTLAATFVDNSVRVNGVDVAPLTVRIPVGGTATLTAAVHPDNASNKTVMWTSATPATAAVGTASGATCEVTGVSAGTTRVTVTTEDGGYSKYASVEVYSIPVTGVTVSPQTAFVEVGATTTLLAKVLPENASVKTVTWSSDKPAVASVGLNTGVVTGASVGTATITVKTDYGNYTAKVTITVKASTLPAYTQRFITLRNKLMDPANGYFSRDGVPYHSAETLICEAPDQGHETTSEAYSYWIWLEVMNGKITGDWSSLSKAWAKMEATAIPTPDQQPTTSSYNPSNPGTYAGEFALPENYPAPLESGVPVGKDPVSADLTAAYGSDVYGMHWLFDCDNFYGYGNKGDGVSTPSYMNSFQRGEQESVWETVPHPSWESFKWGADTGTGFLQIFVKDSNLPAAQWRYTNAPDADARAVQAIYWGVQFAKDQGLAPSTVLPLAKAAKMGDFARLSMFDKYFKPLGVQNKSGPGGTGYDSAHYLLGWYYAWGGPLVSQGWAWRIGCSHAHFGYQNPVAAYALSATSELKPASLNGARDWGQSLTRQLEFYQWLQSAEGAIAGGATNSLNGRYDPYPAGTPTFYGMAYQENPVYHDPGSNTWFGMQAWSMERMAEYYYISNDLRAKTLLDKWVPWARSVVKLNADGSFDIPAEISWSGAPATWVPLSPVPNTNLHVSIVKYGKDLGIAATLAKALTYYAAATQRYGTLDTASRDMAKQILDRMWTKHFEPTGKGVAVVEPRADYSRFFEQVVSIPAGWTGKMANGDVIQPGVTFIEMRSQYLNDPDYPALEAAYLANRPYEKAYHRFWAQAEIALANAEFGRFFSASSRENYTQWQARVFTAAEIANGVGAPLASPAGDDVANVIKFALGCDAPHAPVPEDRKPALSIAANGDVTLAFPSPASGVSYIVERSTDLVEWTVAQRIDDPTSLSQEVLLGNNAGTRRLFGRLRVELNASPEVRVTGVALAPKTATLTSLGQTLAQAATVLPANATNKAVSYRSSIPSVATVDSTGTVVAKANGTTTITVTTADGPFTDTCSITVDTGRVRVTSVTVAPPTASLTTIGQTVALTATVLPSNATDKTVTWRSSNVAAATVDSSGRVTAVGNGTATITATSVDGPSGTSVITVEIGGGGLRDVRVTYTITNNWGSGYSANIDILNTGPQAIHGWTLKFTLPTGDTIVDMWNATYTVTGSQITAKNVAFNATIAPGAKISLGFNANGPAGTPTDFTVYSAQASVPVAGVSLAPSTALLTTLGQTVALAPTVLPANATNKAVSYSSSAMSVAVVDTAGTVTAVTSGTAIITVKTADGAFPATCAVTVNTGPVVRVTGVSLSQSIMSLTEGSPTALLTVAVLPASATNRAVTWTSSNPAVASVSSTGPTTALVSAVGIGSATVTVTSSDGPFSATCSVASSARVSDYYFPQGTSVPDLISRSTALTRSQVKAMMFTYIDRNWAAISAYTGQTDKTKVYALFLGFATRESTLNAGVETAVEEGFPGKSAHAFGPIQTAITAFAGVPAPYMEETDVSELFHYPLNQPNFYDPGISMHLGIRKFLHFIKQAKEAGCTGVDVIRNALKGFNTGWAYPENNPQYYRDYPDDIAAMARWYLLNDHMEDDVFTWTNNPATDRTDPWGWW
jgi:uncharacterized protein YjdB